MFQVGKQELEIGRIRELNLETFDSMPPIDYLQQPLSCGGGGASGIRSVASTHAQLAQQARQCGVVDRDVFLLDQFLVHPPSESVAFLVKPLQQVRINLDLVG